MKKTYKILGKRGRITIPYEIRKSVGFAQNDVLSFEQGKDNRSVVVRREKICDCQDKEKNANKEGFDSAYDVMDYILSFNPKNE